MIKVTKIDKTMYLFNRWIVVMMLSSYDKIKAVKVIVTILTKDSSNKFILKTMMIIPWYIDNQTQMKNVLVFIYLLFLRDV